MSLERCQVRYVEIGPRTVTVPGEGRFGRVSVPPFVQRAYQRLMDTAELRCRPQLVALENARGYGGFYIDGVIAFGLKDLEEIAGNMGEYFPDVPQGQLRWYQLHAPHRLISSRDRLEAATTALLAHELSHAWAAQHGVSKFGVPEEVQADNIAGQLAGHLCTRAELDHAFFHSIGCNSPRWCTHPSPEARVEAYSKGRATTDRCVSGW